MKVSTFPRLFFIGVLTVGPAVGMVIESSVWSPHVLTGKELLNARVTGGACQFHKSPESNNCGSHCSGDTHKLCTGDEGSATAGCYTINGSDVCGESDDPEKTCPQTESEWCYCP